MSMSFRVTAFPIILTAVLSACGSGGGGAGGADRGSVAGEGPFPPQSPAVQTVVMNVNDSASTAELTYDDSNNLSGIDISTPQTTLSYAGADEISCSSAGACTGVNATSLAIVMDQADLGWSYQSFGIWLKDIGPTSFEAGAVSFGTVTPASALPTGLTDARFAGHAGGFYFDASGNQFATDAQMSAVTNFQNRSIQFSTNGTLLTNMSTLERTSSDGLDLRGSWTYAPGTSQFSGSVNTVNNDLKGSAAGRFYGPTAEEIGGTYGLTGGGASMLGGFGGKR